MRDVSVYNLVHATIKRYGRPLTLSLTDGDYETVGYLEPIRFNDRRYLEGEFTPLGEDDSRRYLLLIEPVWGETPLEKQTMLLCGETRYFIQASEMVYYARRPLYCWAVLRCVAEEVDQ